MTSAISVKDRLENQALASGKTMQETLTAYGFGKNRVQIVGVRIRGTIYS